MKTTENTPKWGQSTKLTVALTLVAVVAGLLIKFQGILSPLIIMILLAYLFNPIAGFLSRKIHLPWRLAVSVVYLLAVVLLLALLTLGGVGLIQQFQSMITLIQDNVNNIPTLFNDISGHVINIGPFLFDLRKVDLGVIGQQLIGSIEPLIGRTGTMIGTVASGAANILGWTLFVLLVSYFVLIESDGLWKGILNVHIPGYDHDLERMAVKLAQIWNAFLRGQIIVMGLAALVYSIVLSLLGVNYALGLALLAGVARFVPYVGAFTLWIILALTAYFQDYKLFGIEPWLYALIVVVLSWSVDMIVDNFVTPRIMATALKVHPAAVLVAAIIGLDLLGILGVILAAPMLATLQLVGGYFVRKLFDLDPWEGLQESPPPPPIRQQIQEKLVFLRSKLKFK
jgi:predicted PurR-regulated permease PerM